MNEMADELLDIIEDFDLFIAYLTVDGKDAQEAKDILTDLYYLYAELVKHDT